MQTATPMGAMRRARAGCVAAWLSVLLVACGGGAGEVAPDSAAAALRAPAASPASDVTSPLLRPLSASSTASRPAPPDANALMDWAQTRYPTLFETGPQTASGDYQGQRYAYRHYPRGDNYLGVRDGEVFGLGAFTQQQLTRFGALADYSCEVYPVVCAGAAADVLSISGPGLVAAGGKASFAPAAAASVRETAANCDNADGMGLCTSTLRIEWAASASVRLVVTLHARYPAPGVPPGYGVNGIDLDYAVLSAPGAHLVCPAASDAKTAGAATCDLVALGVRLNPIARALSFTDTPLSVVGGARLVLNGTLTY